MQINFPLYVMILGAVSYVVRPCHLTFTTQELRVIVTTYADTPDNFSETLDRGNNLEMVTLLTRLFSFSHNRQNMGKADLTHSLLP